jgi:hypothetical protein
MRRHGCCSLGCLTPKLSGAAPHRRTRCARCQTGHFTHGVSARTIVRFAGIAPSPSSRRLRNLLAPSNPLQSRHRSAMVQEGKTAPRVRSVPDRTRVFPNDQDVASCCGNVPLRLAACTYNRPPLSGRAISKANPLVCPNPCRTSGASAKTRLFRRGTIPPRTETRGLRDG